jgi:hypothetical protein
MLIKDLKDVTSYRQWNMMDEFCIVNEAKEKHVTYLKSLSMSYP